MKRNIITGGLVALAFVAGSFGSAEAQSLIHSRDIADGGVHRADLSGSINKQLSGVGRAGLPKGAYVSEAVYDNGGNGWATVACNNETDFALDGQIEAGDTSGNGGPVGSYVIASFQGRMDWTTNTPKPGRTDGWVFGVHADSNGNTDTPLIVSAICVPGANLKHVINHY
jgi:hypothetical protein